MGTPKSRIQSIIERVENDQPIDGQKELILMGLDLARIGEEFVQECLERERTEDDKLST